MRIWVNSRWTGARSERDSSTSSGGVAIRPVVVETTSGKKAIRQVMTMRGASSAPSTTMMIGAIATTGVDCTTTSNG